METLEKELVAISKRFYEIQGQLEEQRFFTQRFRNHQEIVQGSALLEMALEREKNRLMEKYNEVYEKWSKLEEVRYENLGETHPRALQDVTHAVDVQRNRESDPSL